MHDELTPMQPTQTEERGPSERAMSELFRRVLVPVNFSAVSQRAVHVGLELHHLCGSEVCVFNLTHTDENDQFLAGLGSRETTGDLLDEGSAAVRRFVDNIAPGQAGEVECDARIGDDYVAGIRAKAAEWGATLLVLSHESHPSLLRTHSEKLMKALNVPVLLLQSTTESTH